MLNEQIFEVEQLEMEQMEDENDHFQEIRNLLHLIVLEEKIQIVLL